MNSYPILIERKSKFYSLDSIMIQAIITQESNWNIYSLRYEAGWPYRKDTVEYAKLLGITEATEMQTQKMSWGLGQIMGTVARELGFKEEMGKLFLPEINIEYMCLLLKSFEKHAKTLPELFACYNGGPGASLSQEQAYIDSCMKHYEDIKNGG